jgi:hypothetical protein
MVLPADIGGLAIWLLCAAAICGIAYMIIRAMKLPIPEIAYRIAGIVVLLVVGIIVINFIRMQMH